jgi:hypothetical protein
MTANRPRPADLPLMANSPRGVDPWNYRPDAGWSPERSLVGYRVEATDGRIGKVHTASHAMGDSYLVVDTGPWIFGSTVVLPAGLVTIIDHPERIVYLVCSKELVKSAPAFEAKHGKLSGRGDRDKLAEHYRVKLSP